MSRFLSSTDSKALAADLAALGRARDLDGPWASFGNRSRTRHRETSVAQAFGSPSKATAKAAAPVAAPARPVLRADSLTLTSTHLAVRLDSFVDWLRQLPGIQACFVADEQGLPLITYGDVDYSPLSSVLQSALGQVRSAVGTPTSGEISLTLNDGRLLQLLECRQTLGSFSLGVVTLERILPEQLIQFQNALQLALASDSSIS